YDPDGFELGDADALTDAYPEAAADIARLTRTEPCPLPHTPPRRTVRRIHPYPKHAVTELLPPHEMIRSDIARSTREHHERTADLPQNDPNRTIPVHPRTP
ncbi:MAG: hypothetical protein OXC00_10765, partial [Acidimicrobiaceae bacterium]|nr:hypothetical protein [Acidimicrobiaceae bacterium]